MSARDLASLRAATGTPPLPELGGEGDAGAGGAYVFHESPSTAAFALSKEAAVNFREITAGDTYRRVIAEAGGLSPAERGALAKLRAAILLRDKWMHARDVPDWIGGPKLPEARESDPKEPTPAPPYDPFEPALPGRIDGAVVEWREGVAVVVGGRMGDGEGWESRTYAEFCGDMERVMSIVDDPEVRTLTWRKLKELSMKFSMYSLLNGDQESLAQKRFPHRDFYNCIRIDNHVHATSMATQKHFLSFMKSKLKKCGDDVVLPNRDNLDGPPLTLRQTFESLNMRAEDLSVDTLDVHHSAGQNLFQRYALCCFVATSLARCENRFEALPLCPDKIPLLYRLAFADLTGST